MSRAFKPPTPEIQQVADLLDETIKQLVGAWSDAPPIGEYEADVECWNFLKLIVRHVESIITLARDDLVLLPSAMVIARAVFELGAKAMWMLAPEDPFHREVRWLAHLESEEEYLRRCAGQFSKGGADGSQIAKFRDAEGTIRTFRTQMTALLPKGYTPLAKMPNVYDMLESIGHPRKYLYYLIGCQHAHGTHSGTSLYRKNLGNMKEYGEFIKLDDWAICLGICWLSLSGPGKLFLARIGGNPAAILSAEFSEKVKSSIDKIPE
jgi:hypothetical protein